MSTTPSLTAAIRMTPIRAALITLLTCLLLPHRALPATPATRITIDPTQKHQTLEGFGASGAWWPSYVADFPQPKQDQLLDLLFTNRGIALSIYRYNLPAGGTPEIHPRSRATPNVETAPNHHDLSADHKALDILRAVRQRGVQRFVLFSNSPPARLTRNNLTSGGDHGDSNLRPGAEPDFATYLLDLATLIRDQYHLPHVTLSPINEPQWNWGKDHRTQEGCHYTPQEAASLLRAVIDANERRHANLTIEAPESGNWADTPTYATALFADPVINQHLPTLALHSYWTDHATKQQTAQTLRDKFPTKHLSMTEYCQMTPGTDTTIDSALDLATTIHDDLTLGDVTTWQWWLAIGPGGYHDALIYASPRTQQIQPTKRLYALGQFSRFLPPGYTRLTTTSPTDSLKTSAYLSPDTNRLVCVLINPTDHPIPGTLDSPNFHPRTSQFYLTDETHDLAKVDQHPDDLTIPPRSISTLVLDR